MLDLPSRRSIWVRLVLGQNQPPGVICISCCGICSHESRSDWVQTHRHCWRHWITYTSRFQRRRASLNVSTSTRRRCSARPPSRVGGLRFGRQSWRARQSSITCAARMHGVRTRTHRRGCCSWRHRTPVCRAGRGGIYQSRRDPHRLGPR